MRQLDSITDSMDMNLKKVQETVKNGGAWHAAVHGGCKKSDMTQQLYDKPLNCFGSNTYGSMQEGWGET